MAVYKSKNATKDGRQYFFRIKYKNILGRTQDYTSQKYKSLKEAKEEEAKYRIKISENKITNSNITIKEAFIDLTITKEKKLKKQSLIKDRNMFRHLKTIENIKIQDLNLNIYKKFLNELNNDNLSVLYKNKILGMLRQIIKHANKYFNTSDAMIKYIENFKNTSYQKKEIDFFTIDEYKKFDSIITDHNYHTFFEILYYLGIRQGEAQALTWQDVDFVKNTISINKTLTTKIKGEKWTISSPKTKNSNRTLPMTRNIIADLKQMKESALKYIDYNDNWFVFGNTHPYAESTIQKKKNDYCDLAKVKRIRIHDFRHSCASLLINQGATIALVSKYLGHANITMTLNTYTHMYKNELENISNLLNNI